MFPSSAKCFPLTPPWLLVSITTNTPIILPLSFCFPSVLRSLYFSSSFHSGFCWNVGKLTGPRPLSLARPRPLLAAKEGSGGQASVSHWAANPPGESHQIELPLCVICMGKEPLEAWLIILADVLPVGDSLSLNGVADCIYNPSENSTTSRQRWRICRTALHKHPQTAAYDRY